MIDYTSYQYDSVFDMSESQLKAVIDNELKSSFNNDSYSVVDRNPTIDSLACIYEHLEVCHAAMSYSGINSMSADHDNCRTKIRLLERKEIDTINAIESRLKPMRESATVVALATAVWLAKAEALKALNRNLAKHRSNKAISEADREKIDLKIKKAEEQIKKLEEKIKNEQRNNKDKDKPVNESMFDITCGVETISHGMVCGRISEGVAMNILQVDSYTTTPFSIYTPIYENSEEDAYDKKIEAIENKKNELLKKKDVDMAVADRRKKRYYIPMWNNILLVLKGIKTLVAKRRAIVAEKNTEAGKKKLEDLDNKISALKAKLEKEKAKEKDVKAKVMNESYTPNSYWEYMNLYEESVVKHDGAKSRMDFFNHITKTLEFKDGLDLIRSVEAAGSGLIKNNHTGKLFRFEAKQNADQYFIGLMTPKDSSQAAAEYQKAMGMINEEIESGDSEYHKEMAKLKGKYQKAKDVKAKKKISGEMAALANKHGKDVNESFSEKKYMRTI